MRRNGYLSTSGENLDTAVRLADPDFLLGVKFWRFGDVFRWFLHLICRMSAIFLLPVCLTYWIRKYITRVDPHVDNSRQVWSWYDHTLPSYSCFVCWCITWPCDLDLWPFDIEQPSYMAGHMANPATNSKDFTIIRLWVTSYNGSHWLPLKMRTPTTFIELRLLSSRQILKPFSGEQILSPVEMGPKNGGLG